MKSTVDNDMAIEEAEVASGAQGHSRQTSTSTISGPLPTDSMVTVRLSDPPVAPAMKANPPASNDNTSPKIQELERQPELDSMRVGSISDIDNNAAILEEELQDTQRRSSVSMASVVEEEQSIRTSGTVRSRSDTSGSFSSNGSAKVDWDELERSEEQAPRDEGSDEVSFHTIDGQTVYQFQTVYRVPPCSP